MKEKFTKDGVLLNGFHRVRSKKFNGSGTFKNGRLNGRAKGTYKYDKGKMWNCNGMWRNNKLEGRGKCTFSKKHKTSAIRDGIWKNDELVKGKVIFPYYSKATKKMQKQIHIGSFKNSKLNGKGLKKWRNSLHEGVWKNDKLVKGKMVLPYYSKTTKKMQKQIDIGSFKNGKLNGKCVKKWRNAIYKGSCKNGKLNGKCVKKWRNGILYKGSCKNDNFHGKGTYNYKGTIYKGNWSGSNDNQKLNGTRDWVSVRMSKK